MSLEDRGQEVDPDQVSSFLSQAPATFKSRFLPATILPWFDVVGKSKWRYYIYLTFSDDSFDDSLSPTEFDYEILTPPAAVEAVEAVENLPPPPPGREFDSVEDGITWVSDFALDYGYAISIGRSKGGMDGVKKTVYLQCDRSRRPPDKQWPGERKTSTRSIERYPTLTARQQPLEA
ncbi:hypothetical protein N7467_006939 [Penicillium canescens]|nr:hypothetical protein N7467_006939 [Penicillium canescens]